MRKFKGRLPGRRQKRPTRSKLKIRRRRQHRMNSLKVETFIYGPPTGNFRVSHLTNVSQEPVNALPSPSVSDLYEQIRRIFNTEMVNFPDEVFERMYIVFNERFGQSIGNAGNHTFEEMFSQAFGREDPDSLQQMVTDKALDVIRILANPSVSITDYEEIERVALFSLLTTNESYKADFMIFLSKKMNMITGRAGFQTDDEVVVGIQDTLPRKIEFVDSEYNNIISLLDFRANLEHERMLCRYIYYLYTLGPTSLRRLNRQELENGARVIGFLDGQPYTLDFVLDFDEQDQQVILSSQLNPSEEARRIIQTKCNHFLRIYKDAHLLLDQYYESYGMKLPVNYARYRDFIDNQEVIQKLHSVLNIEFLNESFGRDGDVVPPLTVFKPIQIRAPEESETVPLNDQTKQIFAIGDTLHDFAGSGRGKGDIMKYLSIETIARIINMSSATYNLAASGIENKLLKDYIQKETVKQNLVFLRVNYSPKTKEDKVKVKGESKSGIVIQSKESVKTMIAYPQISDYLKATIGYGINYLFDTSIAGVDDSLIRSEVEKGEGGWVNQMSYPKLWDPSTSSHEGIQDKFNQLHGTPKAEGDVVMKVNYQRDVFMSVYAKTHLQIYLKAFQGNIQTYNGKPFWSRDVSGDTLQWRLILYSSRTNREYDVTQDEPWLSNMDTFNSVPNMKIIIWCLAKQMEKLGVVEFSEGKIKSLANDKNDKLGLTNDEVNSALQSLCCRFLHYEFSQPALSGPSSYTSIVTDTPFRGFSVERGSYNTFLSYAEVVIGLLFDLKRSGDWGMIEFVKSMNKNLSYTTTINDAENKMDLYTDPSASENSRLAAPWLLWSGDRPAGLASCYNNIPVVSALTTTNGFKHYFVNSPIDRNSPLYVERFKQLFSDRISQIAVTNSSLLMGLVSLTSGTQEQKSYLLQTLTTLEAVRGFVNELFSELKTVEEVRGFVTTIVDYLIQGKIDTVLTPNEATTIFNVNVMGKMALSESMFISVVCFIFDFVLGRYNTLKELVVSVFREVTDLMNNLSTGRRTNTKSIILACRGIYEKVKTDLLTIIHNEPSARDILTLFSTPNIGKNLLDYFIGMDFKTVRDFIRSDPKSIGKKIIETLIKYQPIVDHIIDYSKGVSGQLSPLTMTLMSYLSTIVEMLA